MLEFSSEYQDILRPVFYFSRSKKIKLYIVGGALRDLFLKRKKQNPDLDFCLKKGALNFGKLFAQKLKAAYIILDSEHASCRVAKKIGERIFTFDFTDFRAPTIEKDLLHRDFTINSMALELADVFSKKDLSPLIIDPYSGRKDIESMVIRITAKSSFTEDPLRILRAFSFSCMLGFTLDKETLNLAKKEKDKIASVSSERIRDELFKVFDSNQAHASMVALDKIKILEIIFPEIKPMRGIGQGPYHHLDVWQHTLETLNQFELILKSIHRKEINDYLEQEVSGLRKRASLLKFACILHDIGKPPALRKEKGKIIFHGHERVGLGITRLIWRRLKLSNEEGRSLERIVLCHLRPGYLADYQRPTERAIFRYFRDGGNEALAVLLISLADQRATKGPLTTAMSRVRHEKTIKMLVHRLLKKNNEKKQKRLLDGFDIMKKLKLNASPLIGKILAALEEAQAIGKIRTKAQGLKLAENLVKKLK